MILDSAFDNNIFDQRTGIKSIGPDFFQGKIVNIFLPISFNISFEYQQHMFWLRNKKIDSWGREQWMNQTAEAECYLKIALSI